MFLQFTYSQLFVPQSTEEMHFHEMNKRDEVIKYITPIPINLTLINKPFKVTFQNAIWAEWFF